MGALLVVFTPNVVAGLVNSSSENTRFASSVAEAALQVFTYVLPPLGGALIAGGIVMKFLEQLLRDGAPAVDREHADHRG